MAKVITDNKDRILWNEVKKMNHSNKSVPNVVESVSGAENINKLFTTKFKGLYNSVGFKNDELSDVLLKINSCIDNYVGLVNYENYISYKI